MSPEPASRGERPRRKSFTSRSARIPMAPDAAARQGQVAMLAWEMLGDGDAAQDFLNSFDAALGGRPPDVATSSAVSFGTVEAALRSDRRTMA